MAPSRAGEALLRLASSTRLSTRPRAVGCIAHSCRGRLFTTTPCPREGREAPSVTSVNEDISSLLDSTLDLNKGTPSTPASRNSRFKSRDAQQNSGARGLASETGNAQARKQTSVEAILEGMSSHSAAAHRRRPSPIYKSADIYDTFSAGSSSVPPELTKEAEPVILPPNVGRLVQVDPKKNVDVARAFRTMEAQCSRNRVKRSFAQQRFHERPGLKRKRLKHERWIKRFKENFKGTVRLVQKMKKQGW